MRLPSRPQDELAAGDRGRRHRPRRRRLASVAARPMIVVAGHVGNNEAVAAAIAQRGYPGQRGRGRLRRSRRCSRSCAGSASRGACTSSRGATCASCSRSCAATRSWRCWSTGATASDGIPVRLFGAWTTLPAGPATLAAKTGRDRSRRWRSGGRRAAGSGSRPTSRSPCRRRSPADLQRATQRIADALERTVAAAPEQWYSFKPMWPHDRPRPGSSRHGRRRCSTAGPGRGPGSGRAGGRGPCPARPAATRRPPRRRPRPACAAP